MKKILFLLLLISTFFTFLPNALFAKLEWKKTTITYQAKAEDESVTALFHFINSGKKPIRILSTKSSCGCTVAELDKKEFAPGEMGVVRVKFTFGERTGQQTKQIQIYTDDAKALTYLLALQVEIPKFLSLQPQLLFWTKGEAPVAKSTIVDVESKEPINIEKIESEDANFAVELTKIEEGRRYRVTVTPKSTEFSRQAKATLVTNIGKEKPKTTTLVMQVY